MLGCGHYILGQVARFRGYYDDQPGVTRIFRQGQLIVITRIEGEGAYRCAALSAEGLPDEGETDLVLAEEICSRIHFADLP